MKLIERRFEKNDLSSLLDLLRLSYNGWHSAEYWTWKYTENPHGRPLIWVAEDKGKIVGCYILNPVRIRLGRISVLGAQSVDAAVDPTYRGAGIFKKLAMNTITQASKEGIVITYAFPTDIAYKGQVRIGYQPMFILPKMYKILHMCRLAEEQLHTRPYLKKFTNILRLHEKISRRRVRVESDDSLRIQRLNNFDSRFEAFWKRVYEQNEEILIERDLAYLRWRYFKHPEKNYIVYACEENSEVVGYSVLTVEKNVSMEKDNPGKLSIGNIIDFVTIPNMSNAGLQLVSRSLDYFERENVDVVGCWMFKRHPYYKILQKWGFSQYYELFRRSHAQFIIYVNSKATLLKALESKPAKTKLHWFIMQGDADYS
jgi:GNAT superfamily N-acetyltransferase